VKLFLQSRLIDFFHNLLIKTSTLGCVLCGRLWQQCRLGASHFKRNLQFLFRFVFKSFCNKFEWVFFSSPLFNYYVRDLSGNLKMKSSVKKFWLLIGEISDSQLGSCVGTVTLITWGVYRSIADRYLGTWQLWRGWGLNFIDRWLTNAQ
jgi:hypothetical protein